MFFQFQWRFFQRPPPPPIYKLFSPWIWTNHKIDLKYFKKRGNPRIRGSLACLFLHPPPSSRASQELRDKEEKRWSHRLSSVVPRGLNLFD